MKAVKLLIALALSIMLIFMIASCDSGDNAGSEENSDKTDTGVADGGNESTGDDDNTGDNTDEEWKSKADSDVITEAEALLQSKHRLEYNEDGSFRVMILADVHMNAYSDSDKVLTVKNRIKKLVDEIKPNLVILTGDNTINSSTEEKLRTNIDAIVSYIEEKQIPWCHVYGNHDHENALSNAQQQLIYQSYEYCISKDVGSLSGTGTYVHGVYKKDGSLGSLIWLIDSGAYDTQNGGYDYIKQDQIDWYKRNSLLIKEYNNGTHVNGMMAFHIPLIENVTANENKTNTDIVYEYTGNVNEAMCPSKTDTSLLETIFELENIKLIVTGHDHKNDYMFNYEGVKLSSSPNISDLTYFDSSCQGSRIIDLNAQTMDNVPTYVEYLIKRYDPNDYESLEKNIVIEDFEGNFADPVSSGWANQALSGTVTFERAEGKGADGTDALMVSRDNTGNFEFVIDISSVGKVGENEYVVVWMDLTQINFRKACVGLASSDGYKNPYRTDDNDNTYPKYYYLADGSDEWIELSHGKDGCFGRDDGDNPDGYKGYFAFKIDDLRQGSKAMDENTLVTGFYFYGSLYWGEAYLNKPFYFDNVTLCKDYLEIIPSEK